MTHRNCRTTSKTHKTVAIVSAARRRARLMMLAAAPAAILMCSTAWAGIDSWTGSANDGLWSSPSNWSATPLAGDTLLFGATAGTTTLTDDNALSFAAVIFGNAADGSAAASYTINGSGTLTIAGNLTDRSNNGSTETLNLAVSAVGMTYSGTGNSGLLFNNGGTFTGGLTDISNGATADTLGIGAGQTVSFAATSTIGVAAGTANSTTSVIVTGTSTSTLSLTANLSLG
jgi:hypothetical protein